MKKFWSMLLAAALLLPLFTPLPVSATSPAVRWSITTYSSYGCIHNVTKIYKVSTYSYSKTTYGILDRYGNQCLEPVYNEIDFDKNAEIGMMKYSEDEAATYYGLFDKYGNLVEPVEYPNGSVMRDGDNKLFVLGKDGTYLIYGENGEKLLECRGVGSAFSENKLAVQDVNGKWGYINSKGNLVIPYTLDVPGRFDNGVGYPAYAGTDGSAPIINGKGEILHDAGAGIEDATLEKIEAGYAIYKSGEHYGVIDSEGNGVLPFDYLDISVYPTDGSIDQPYFIAQKMVFSNDPYGVVDRSNNTVVQFEYDKIHGLITVGQKVYFTVGKISGVGIVDNTGRITVPIEYLWITEAKENPDYTVSVIANKNSKIGVIDLNNRIITPFQYSSIDGVTESFKVRDSDGIPINYYVLELFGAYNGGDLSDTGYIVETADGRCGVVDGKGNMLLPTEFDWIEQDWVTGFAKARKEKWGIIDYKGRVRVPFLYAELGRFQNGFCDAKTEDGKIGFLDENGAEMLFEEDKGLSPSIVSFTPSGYGGLNNRIIDCSGDTVFTPPEGYVYQKGYNGQIGIFTDENGKYGCLFSDGSIAIPFLYEDISYCTVYGGISHAVVKSGGTYRIIDQNGNLVLGERVEFKQFSASADTPFIYVGHGYWNNPFFKNESETVAVRPSVHHLGARAQANRVTVTASISDLYETIASIELRIDGIAVEDSMKYFDAADGEFQYQTELTDGQHSVSLIATNSVGRQSYPDICNFTVCSTEPEIAHSPPAAFPAGDSITISATADSSVHTVYLYYQDGNSPYQAIPMQRDGNTYTCTVDKAFYDLHYYFKSFSSYGISVSEKYRVNSDCNVIEGQLTSGQLTFADGEVRGDIAFTAQNNTGAPLAVQAIAGLYNEAGQLCGMVRRDMELISGSNAVAWNALCFADVPAGTYKAKIFVWNKGGAMLPLMEPLEVLVN